MQLYLEEILLYFFFKTITENKKLKKISFYPTDERLVDKKSNYSNYNNLKRYHNLTL